MANTMHTSRSDTKSCTDRGWLPEMFSDQECLSAFAPLPNLGIGCCDSGKTTYHQALPRHRSSNCEVFGAKARGLGFWFYVDKTYI